MTENDDSGPLGTATTETAPTVAAERVHAVIVRALERAGASEADARVQADMLVEGDLRGHASHGIRRLPVLVGRLQAGVARSGNPVLAWTAPGALRVDGDRGLGPVVAHRTIDALLDRAAETGVAVGAIRNAGHVGMLAPYVERIAAANCIGIALTVSEALVHPWGGATAMVGTNPIGIGVPTDGEPFVLDMSTASTSMGKVLDYAARGEELPAGWAVDADGHPTTDAVAASRGAVSPFGGPKGYGLALGFEAIVGVLAGSAFGRDVFGTLDTEHAPTKGDLFIVLSLDAFGGGGGAGGARTQLGALSSYLDAVRLSAADGGVVSVPGDRARLERARRSEHGIPLDPASWRTALDLAGPDPATPDTPEDA